MTSTISSFGPPTEVREADTVVADLLAVLRKHLGMDLAWLGRWEDDLLVVQVLSGDAWSFGLRPGMTIRRDRTFYDRFETGELPTISPDCHADPRTAHEPIVEELGVGSYAAKGVVDTDGEVYGMLGCISHQPRPALHPRDSRFLDLVTAFLGDAVIDLQRMWEERSKVTRAVARLIDSGGPDVVFQPIFDLADHTVIAVEALSRFPRDDGGRDSEPERWFAEAAAVGLGPDLELAAIHRALRALPDLPPGMVLAVNASPTTVCSGLADAVRDAGVGDRLAVEITEHEYFNADSEVTRGVAALRGHGVRIAVDDIGTGYAGLEQLLHLRPDVIKQDHLITRGIDADPARLTIAVGLVRMAEEIGGEVVAEGIETPGELDAVIRAGIRYGQGHLLGRPVPSVRAAIAG